MTLISISMMDLAKSPSELLCKGKCKKVVKLGVQVCFCFWGVSPRPPPLEFSLIFTQGAKQKHILFRMCPCKINTDSTNSVLESSAGSTEFSHLKSNS